MPSRSPPKPSRCLSLRSTPYDVYPRDVRMKPFDLTVYRFVDGSHDEGALRIDVGGADDLHLIRFHGKERLERTEGDLPMDAGSSFFSARGPARTGRWFFE